MAKSDNSTRVENRMRFAFDSGFGFFCGSGTHPPPPDSSSTTDDDAAESAAAAAASDSDSDSDSKSNTFDSEYSSISVGVLAESVLKMELAELEMIKAIQASNLEAQKRRLELELELTQMISQTQLQIASSYLCLGNRKGTNNRKRKRSDDQDNFSTFERGDAVLLNLLFQCNLLLL